MEGEFVENISGEDYIEALITCDINDMITVFEMKGKASEYRTVNLSTATSFKSGNVEMLDFGGTPNFKIEA